MFGFGDAHKHDELPRLPAMAPVDRYGDRGLTCPAVESDGTICGQEMAYAHTVREYHSVHRWAPGLVVLGEVNEVDTVEDPDRHLWCANGHDWAVPEGMEFE